MIRLTTRFEGMTREKSSRYLEWKVATSGIPRSFATWAAARPEANGEWAWTILKRRSTSFFRKAGSISAMPVLYGGRNGTGTEKY